MIWTRTGKGMPGTTPLRTETERVRHIWEKQAPRYDRRISFYEKVLFSGDRRWVCSQAEGEVLEIGVGTGRNLEHYPPGVRLTGIDISPPMIDIARQRAGQLGRDIDLRVADAQALDFPDQSFDTVVCTLSLCSIPDDRQAVREVSRVLRPGGRFLFVEHVRSPVLPVRVVQRAIDGIAVRTQGDHLVREPLEHMQAENFRIERIERLRWGIVERGVARKPS